MDILLPLPVTCAKTFLGLPEEIGAAREWVRCVLGEQCPRLEDAVLVASELATNTIRHSASGAAAGRFALQIELTATSAGLTCIDMGPALAPAPRPAGEGGRGLQIVKCLTSDYTVRDEPTSRTVRCRLVWPEQDGEAR
ncbi:ATP-binding protein [Nonomuraea endophytica]|uniref:ATP-binding protein n=1 Tax=Nonomuraea endophytica TaxID=714136 RepID=UPI0037C6504B